MAAGSASSFQSAGGRRRVGTALRFPLSIVPIVAADILGGLRLLADAVSREQPRPRP